MKKYPYIFLTGCMGSGKSTVGAIVARKLGRPFIDLDKYIEKKEGKKINQIFKEQGEDAFRKMETEALLNLPEKKAVIATGGGVVLKEENRKIMKDLGAVLFLDIPPEKLAKRLSNDNSRPLLRGKNKEEELKKILEVRGPMYQDCTYRIDAEDLTPLQAAQEVIHFMKS